MSLAAAQQQWLSSRMRSTVLQWAGREEGMSPVGNALFGGLEGIRALYRENTYRSKSQRGPVAPRAS